MRHSKNKDAFEASWCNRWFESSKKSFEREKWQVVHASSFRRRKRERETQDVNDVKDNLATASHRRLKWWWKRRIEKTEPEWSEWSWSSRKCCWIEKKHFPHQSLSSLMQISTSSQSPAFSWSKHTLSIHGTHTIHTYSRLVVSYSKAVTQTSSQKRPVRLLSKVTFKCNRRTKKR